MTIVWIEHVVHALLAVADRLLVIHFGKRLAEGSPAAVMDDPEVQARLSRTGGLSMSAILETRALSAFYGDFQALFGIDVTVNSGEVIALIGSNGAGKSTFLKTLAGLLRTRPPSRSSTRARRSAACRRRASSARASRSCRKDAGSSRAFPSKRTCCSAGTANGRGAGICRPSTSFSRLAGTPSSSRRRRSRAASSRWSRSAAR